MNKENCKHEGKKDFSFQNGNMKFVHKFCPKCGWHEYKDREYTKKEWNDAFVKDKE